MRVGYIFNHHDIVGGGEISFIDLICIVPKLGVTPIIFTPKKGEVSERFQSIKVNIKYLYFPKVIFSNVFQILIALWKCFWSLFTSNLKIVHVNGARAMLYIGPIAFILGIKCIWHIRIADRDKKLDKLRSFFATKIITNSNFVKNSIDQVTNKSNKSVCIYNGFPIEEMKTTSPINLRSKLNLSDVPIVLSGGRFSPEKRFEDLVGACAQIRNIDFFCCIIGRVGPGSEEYATKLKQLPYDYDCQDKIRYLDWDNNGLIPYLKSADIFVLPSAQEPFGRITIEAICSKIPIAATASGGTLEILSHKETGYLFKPSSVTSCKEALLWMLTHPEERQVLAQNAFSLIDKYSIENHSKQIVDIYSKLIN